jgi:uncharacterized protein (DUF1501 family)
MLTENRPQLDRREFIKTSTLLGAGISLPFFFNQSLSAKVASNLKTPLDRRILVVLELRGGNDGLNTVVPYGNDAYYNMRAKLAIKKDMVLTLNDSIGLNENLKGLMSLYDDGKLALINGVGYPNPNRSHFRSMEIWQTATDSDRVDNLGWIGKYHDVHPDHNPDPLSGVAIDNELPMTMRGERGLGIAFQDPRMFRWKPGPQGDTNDLFRQINKASLNHQSDQDDPLHFLRHVTGNIVRSSDRVIAASKAASSKVEYPKNALARNLQTVAKLIEGGLPTHVYNVAYGGFDTHANQTGQHQNLMSGFGDSLAAFMKDIKARGIEDRVMILCFSEFGRRPQENASGGTDHGTAGPMFLIGNAAKAGLHGKYPSLTDLDDNRDLKYSVDFRAVYAEVLNKWFHADASALLGRKFNGLDLINAQA